MICTSNYKNFDETYNGECGTLVSISGDGGALCNFKGKVFKKLAPKRGFWQQWHDNIGKISEEENNKFYIEHFYSEVLKNLDAKEIAQELDGSILLCYEDKDEFCHRHLVAFWLELEAGIGVPEMKLLENKFDSAFPSFASRPYYIRDYLRAIIQRDCPEKLVKKPRL